MERNSSILVAGGNTLIGGAIRDELLSRGYTNLVPGGAGAEPDYTDGGAVGRLFREARPEYVFVAAGKSGGISANQKYPADLMRQNMAVAGHLMSAAHENGARKLLYLASSCSYPRDCPQPMKPEYLFSGPPEPTNEAYAMAKLAGIVMCKAYRSQYGRNFVAGIPGDVFGPGDDFDPENSHVVSALIRKMHFARRAGAAQVEIWGTGKARRDFLFSRDLASACIFIMERYDGETPINIGTDSDVTIGKLAQIVQCVVGFAGRLAFDRSRPDGAPVKRLDASVLKTMGWSSTMALPEAIRVTYDWFVRNCCRPAEAAGG